LYSRAIYFRSRNGVLSTWKELVHLKTKKSEFVYVMNSEKLTQSTYTLIARRILQEVFRGEALYSIQDLEALKGTPEEETYQLKELYDQYAEALEQRTIVKLGNCTFSAATCINMTRSLLDVMEKAGDIEILKDKI
jgi:hypothetical protein